MALLVPLSLAACGGGDDSKAQRAATSLPRPTHASARDSGPTPGTEINLENPQRFIERWAAVEARMQNTGRTAAYLALSRGCVPCRRLAHTVEHYYAAGGYVHGGGWRIDSIRSSPSSSGYETYTVRARTAPAAIRESSSSRVLRLPSRRVSYEISLLADGSSYTVVQRTLGT
jgi:hypothetical protein